MNALQAIKEDVQNISKVVELYRDHHKSFKKDLEIRGKSLERANVEQPGLLSYYDEKRIELRSIVAYLQIQLEKTYGKKWKDYTELYNRELSQKDKENYIKHDPAYVSLRILYLELEELLGLFESAVESFKARGFALNNVTKAKVADVGDSIL